MCSYISYLLFGIISVFISVRAQYFDFFSNYLYSRPTPIIPNAGDVYLMQDKLRPSYNVPQQDIVKIQLFYECLCPDCRNFDVSQFAPTVKKLGNYLDVQLYPYGNARTTVYPNGKIDITCQHGPAECYGNKLHACAIDYLKNVTKAVEFNSCMMDYSQNNKGSDDEAADKCGRFLNINPQPIKTCAKSTIGLLLLKQYGDASKAAGFTSVPYILINGVENSGDNFLRDVCAAFKNPPKECSEGY